jgi:hypothetical protein
LISVVPPLECRSRQFLPVKLAITVGVEIRGRDSRSHRFFRRRGPDGKGPFPFIRCSGGCLAGSRQN